jgi:capsular polysaccharide biosynthesis protein
MRAELKPLFGQVPAKADNLEIVGLFQRRLEEWAGATVWPQSGVVRRVDGAVEVETIWVERHLESCGDYQSAWSWLPRAKRGKFFNLSLLWWPNYYHWHCDVLPRLLWALPRLDADVKVILPPNLTEWQKRSLELIGLSPQRCVSFNSKRPWKVEQFVYASPMAMTGDQEPESLLQVRDVIRKKLGCDIARPGARKLYLARTNAHARGVVNEAELLPLLAARGFETVDCGALDYDSQVKLFSEAGTVVGPHGAAFTNLLWAAPGARVLEIFEPGSVRRCYWSMSSILGHKHDCGIGDRAPNGRAEDMKIDAGMFAAALAVVCAE